MNVPLLILVAGLGLAGAQSDADTDCAALDFTTLPKTCCNQPYGDVFPVAKLLGLKECKSSSSLLAWLNSYQLNTLQSKDIKNFIDDKSKAYISKICAPAIFVECVFKANNFFLDTGAIDIAGFKDFIYNNAPSAAWKTLVTATLDPINPDMTTAYAFTDIVEDNFEKVTCSTGTVNMVPLILAQMLQSEFIWMCPKQNEYTTVNKCSATMKNFQYCDGKIYSSSSKGIFFFPYV